MTRQNEGSNRQAVHRAAGATLGNHESDEWHRLIVDNLNDVIWAAEVEGVKQIGELLVHTAPPFPDVKGLMNRWRFTYVSSSFEHFIGYPFPETEPWTPFDLVSETHHTLVISEFLWYLREAMDNPEGVSAPNAVLLPLHTGSGVPCWSETIARMLYDQQHDLLRVVGITRNVTKRYEAEEALRQEQRRLARLLEIYEGHREMAAGEIHDGVAQPLISALMTLDAFSHVRDGCPSAPWADFDASVAALREALLETRRFMSAMRPTVLNEFGVVAALEHLIREHCVSNQAAIEFECDVSFERLDPLLETTVFRVVQEGLANARQHSRSDRIRVEFVQNDDRLKIQVQDWGVGFNPNEIAQEHFGIEGIQQRVAAVGGTTRIESTVGVGTRICVDLPVIKPAADGHKPIDREKSTQAENS